MTRLIYTGIAALLLTGCGDRPVDQQLTRVIKDGQECVVVERRWGRVEAVDCNWGGR